MATLTRGETFTTTVTAAMLHALVDNATITGIAAADIASNAVTTAKILDANVTAAKLSGSGVKMITLSVNAATGLTITNSGDVAWTDLDLTTPASLPATATAVILSGYFKDSTANASNSYLAFRKNGSTNGTSIQSVQPTADGFNAPFFFIVPCDTGQVIEYTIGASGANTTNGVVYVIGYLEDLP